MPDLQAAEEVEEVWQEDDHHPAQHESEVEMECYTDMAQSRRFPDYEQQVVRLTKRVYALEQMVGKPLIMVQPDCPQEYKGRVAELECILAEKKATIAKLRANLTKQQRLTCHWKKEAKRADSLAEVRRQQLWERNMHGECKPCGPGCFCPNCAGC